MLVEVLTFDGCPHAAPALELVQRVVAETGMAAEVRVVNVSDAETEARRFLGSPSIRIEGRDVEPGADTRDDYAFTCRLYRTAAGLRPLPEASWLRDALPGQRQQAAHGPPIPHPPLQLGRRSTALCIARVARPPADCRTPVHMKHCSCYGCRRVS